MGALLSSETLRIAYLGNFTRPWCTEVQVAASLERLGHHVVRLQEHTTNIEAVPRLVRSRRCSMLLWQRTWSTPLDAGLRMLDALRRQGVLSASFHLDRWVGLAREPMLASEPFFRTDLVVTADGTCDVDDWAALGINHRWLPPAVFDVECTHVEPDRQRFPHDIVFVGSHPYPHDEWQPVRSAMIDALQQRYRERFAVYPMAGRPVRGRSLAQLYASARVVVGDSCLVPPVRNYWSDRVPETMGRGGYLVHPHVDGLRDWYPELPTFAVGDHDALFALVDDALDHERDARAHAQRQRQLVLSRDTYAHRMSTLIDWLREVEL